MAFDFQAFCDEHGIQAVAEGHKHCRPGWVQVPCPFCSGNAGFHLGWNEQSETFHCWRCGKHRTVLVLAELAGISTYEARKMMDEHQGRPKMRLLESRPRRKTCKLPPGCGEMGAIHRKYLKKRNFDPDHLEEEWGLMGCSGVGPYKFRIIAPIHFEGQMISFQGRDVTDKSPLKYKACPQEMEVMDHKTVLYGLDKVDQDTVVIVEGITDVWRLGPGAVATFGIKFKSAQVALLKNFTRRRVLFDHADPQARIQSEKLANALSAFAGETEVIDVDGTDPGDLSPDEAKSLMLELLS